MDEVGCRACERMMAGLVCADDRDDGRVGMCRRQSAESRLRDLAGCYGTCIQKAHILVSAHCILV